MSIWLGWCINSCDDIKWIRYHLLVWSAQFLLNLLFIWVTHQWAKNTMTLYMVNKVDYFSSVLLSPLWDSKCKAESCSHPKNSSRGRCKVTGVTARWVWVRAAPKHRGSLGAPRELTITFKQSSEVGPTVKRQEGVGGCVGITVAPNLTGLIGSALNVLEPPHILLNPRCGRSELVLVVQEAPRAN